MKIRNGFVSNSSSSSFLIEGDFCPGDYAHEPLTKEQAIRAIDEIVNSYDSSWSKSELEKDLGDLTKVDLTKKMNSWTRYHLDEYLNALYLRNVDKDKIKDGDWHMTEFISDGDENYGSFRHGEDCYKFHEGNHGTPYDLNYYIPLGCDEEDVGDGFGVVFFPKTDEEIKALTKELEDEN